MRSKKTYVKNVKRYKVTNKECQCQCQVRIQE